MQPSKSQLEMYRGWSSAWLASWLPFDIASLLFFPQLTLPLSLFFRGVSLFTRRILVAQDEFGGYLLSIDRFWQHAKSFWPSLRGLTFPFIYPSFSLSLCFSYFFLSFFTSFSYHAHFFDPEPSCYYFTTTYLFFFYRSDAFSLSPCAVFDGCFLVFFCYFSFSSVFIFSSRL